MAPFLPWIEIRSPEGFFSVSISLYAYSGWAVLLPVAGILIALTSLAPATGLRPIKAGLVLAYAAVAAGQATSVLRASGGDSQSVPGLGAVLAMVGWVLVVSAALARHAPRTTRVEPEG